MEDSRRCGRKDQRDFKCEEDTPPLLPWRWRKGPRTKEQGGLWGSWWPSADSPQGTEDAMLLPHGPDSCHKGKEPGSGCSSRTSKKKRNLGDSAQRSQPSPRNFWPLSVGPFTYTAAGNDCIGIGWEGTQYPPGCDHRGPPPDGSGGYTHACPWPESSIWAQIWVFTPLPVSDTPDFFFN